MKNPKFLIDVKTKDSILRARIQFPNNDNIFDMDDLIIYIKDRKKFFEIIIRNSLYEHRSLLLIRSNHYLLGKIEILLFETK